MAENFQFPFQCIELVRRENGTSKSVLVASAGTKLYSYAAETGQRLASWPEDASTSTNAGTLKASSVESNGEEQGPPGKKRKVAADADQTLSDTPSKQTTWSNIPILTSTSNGKYVVALTAEDKCIRVFEIEENGSFKQLSARGMPKRPCAITFTDDDSTILSADKFGDVYSLPLIPSDKPHTVAKATMQARPSGPSATPLTVHTQRNLRSLEMQMKMKAKKAKEGDKPSDAPTFERQLLLGHVSLLTDLAFVSLPSKDPSSTKSRSYLLTADRDEHIRVSRGPPQAHVIENYCLGHTTFVSQLCIPKWAPEYLISGGGDSFLLVWKWAEGQILQQVPLVDQEPEAKEVAVRGIWAASFGSDSSNPRRVILVALEGSAQLQCFTLESDGTLRPQGFIQLSGNVLDVETIEQSSTVIISVDCVRSPGTTQEWRPKPASPSNLLEAFHLKPGTETLEWEPASEFETMVSTINSIGTPIISVDTEPKLRQEMDTSVYGLENLRKKIYDNDD